MKKFSNMFKNEFGMSMAEMAVALGLAGAAAVGVASLMGSMGGSSKDAETVIEKTQFASALGVFLGSAGGCNSFQQQPTPFPVTESDYTITNWVENGKPKEFRFDGMKNFSTDYPMRFNTIKYLRAFQTDVPNVNPIIREVSGVPQTLKKAMVKVRVGITKKGRESDPVQRRASEMKYPESKYEYNIPVMVDAATNRIVYCGDGSTMAEACFALKGRYDDSTGKCELEQACESFGNYAVVDCAPKFGGVNCQDYSRGTPFVNPVTGGYSCPSGASALSTGGQTWYKTIDCGKKCEARVNFSIGYYSCLKCN